MRLLVTGATGFAGNALLDLLTTGMASEGVRLLVLPGDPGVARVLARKIPHLAVVEGSVTDETSVAAAMEGVTHVIHLAGVISYWYRDRALMTSVNVDGARIVAEAAARAGVRRMVHISSVGAIGFDRHGRPADETTPFNWPSTFSYMTTKRAGQEAVEAVARRTGLPVVILNPASLMGPGDPDPGTAHNRLYGSIAGGPFFGCFAGGLAVTDVRDLAAIALKALTRGTPGECYLVVGANVTYVDVVREIGRSFDRPVYPFRIPPFLLAAAGSALELASVFTGRRPLLTPAYGRLSGWHTYYANTKSVAAFEHAYIPFATTIADACASWAAHHGRAARDAAAARTAEE